MEDFLAWEKGDDFPAEVADALKKPVVRERLVTQIEILDRCYGRERDLKRDLGGFCVVLSGERGEVLAGREKLLREHNLCDDEFEIEDRFECPEDNLTVCFQLFLCSSDYGIEMMMVFKNDEKHPELGKGAKRRRKR